MRILDNEGYVGYSLNTIEVLFDVISTDSTSTFESPPKAGQPHFPRRYVRTVCPRKSNPCSICVTTVFSGESSHPRSLRNCSTSGLTSCSRSSFELPVIQKSSAYRIRFTFARFPALLVFEKWEARSRSNPSSVIFATAGEMMPPWGVPSSVGWKRWFSR